MVIPFGNVIANISLFQAAVGNQDPIDRLINDLVLQASGQSYRNIDMPSMTEADVACMRLKEIGMPAIPAILKSLESPNGWAKVHGIEMLAYFKYKPAVGAILKIMNSDPETGVRGIAAENLGAFGDQSVIRDLLVASKSKDRDLRRGAWRSLGTLKAVQAIPILIQNIGAQLKSSYLPTETSDSLPSESLVNIGKPAVPALIVCFNRSGTEVRKVVATALGQIGSPVGLKFLESARNHPETRSCSISGLLENGGPVGVSVARRVFSHSEFNYEAFSCLSRHSSSTLRSLVRRGLELSLTRQDMRGDVLRLEIEWVRERHDLTFIPLLKEIYLRGVDNTHSLRALASMKDKHLAPFFLSCVPRKTIPLEESVWNDICEGFLGSGRNGLAALLDVAKKRPGEIDRLTYPLGRFEDPSLGSDLVKLLETDRRLPIIAGALTALGSMRYQQGANSIAIELTHPSKGIQALAAISLGKLGDRRAIAPLLLLSLGKSPYYTLVDWHYLGIKALPALKQLFEIGDLTAIRALGSLESPEAHALLIKGILSNEAPVSTECIKALTGRHDPAITPVLRKAMESKALDVRFEAYMAIQRFAKS